MIKHVMIVIISLRDRKWHLSVLLYYLHPMLQRQQIQYQIFVVEQAGQTAFNRGALMNVGYKEASKIGAFNCFILHDVDLVPEDDRNIYSYNEDTAKHLAVAVNKWKYRLSYLTYFGGVTALSKNQMEKSNGFANSFYGWGGEDDDLYHRVVQLQKFPVSRYPGNIGRFSMLKHGKEAGNDEIGDLMEKSKNNELVEDGLSNLVYEKLNEKKNDLYTWFLVKLPPPPEKVPKPAWENFQEALWGGMNSIAGGFAAQVAKEVGNLAQNQVEDAQKHINAVYR